MIRRGGGTKAFNLRGTTGKGEITRERERPKVIGAEGAIWLFSTANCPNYGLSDTSAHDRGHPLPAPSGRGNNQGGVE